MIESPLKPLNEAISASEMEEKTALSLQRAVKQLHFGCPAERAIAAREIKDLARADLRTRRSLASLGVVPSLVSMVGCGGSSGVAAVEALIELAHGTYTNKALMVEAGLLSKLPHLLNTPENPSITNPITTLLSSLSTLINTTLSFPSNSTNLLQFLIHTLTSATATDASKSASLATLSNLSQKLDFAHAMLSNGAMRALARASFDERLSETALSTMGNLVTVKRLAAEEDESVVKALMEVLAWEGRPKCRELALYVLMVLAHKSGMQRRTMAREGVVPLLLEVALLGSTLARKRAMRMLGWFKEEREREGAGAGACSGPSTPRKGVVVGGECRRCMKGMVKQSLDRNMELIVRRAGRSVSGDGFDVGSLLVSSSSKSLPY
ncbi:hypothetical protein QJS10_CPA03g00144 [Acorus calamus]|uniref:Uncharacterized protein n=1 Tax=Acorus calamus TaxID=4465 RepID=A0AAV9F525_ACOCL|nr:hypothetical protein QJS10_CPA03g00144 [Acorus calamus]